MFVAILRVELHFPESASLKAKRSDLNSVKAHLRQRHGASVAEVDHHDSWQRSTVAVAVVGRTAGETSERADGVGRYLDARLEGAARVERRLASWPDLESIG